MDMTTQEDKQSLPVAQIINKKLFARDILIK